MTSKNSLIISGKYQSYKKIKYANFVENSNNLDLQKRLLENNFNIEEIEQCQKIYNAERFRKKYNFDYIVKWLFCIKNIKSYNNYKIIFGTLTFTNKTLSDTSKETRRRYTTRFLKNVSENYVANIDFGAKNGREHYHFLALCKNNIDTKLWNYGNIDIQNVKIDCQNIKASKNYLLKLNNHSFKDSTKQTRLIKDRNKDIENIIDILCPIKYKQFKAKVISDMLEP